jgi:hypothetical protein
LHLVGDLFELYDDARTYKPKRERGREREREKVLFIVTSVKKSTPHNCSNLIYNTKLSEISTHQLRLIIFASYSDNVTL